MRYLDIIKLCATLTCRMAVPGGWASVIVRRSFPFVKSHIVIWNKGIAHPFYLYTCIYLPRIPKVWRIPYLLRKLKSLDRFSSFGTQSHFPPVVSTFNLMLDQESVEQFQSPSSTSCYCSNHIQFWFNGRETRKLKKNKKTFYCLWALLLDLKYTCNTYIWMQEVPKLSNTA